MDLLSKISDNLHHNFFNATVKKNIVIDVLQG